MDNKKYQVSVKLNDGFIYVAHVDTREELEDEIIYFKGLITNDLPWISDEDKRDMAEAIETKTEKLIDQAMEETKMCDEHNLPMKKNKNGKWYHREYKEGKTRFCNGYNFGDWQ